ncbi:unnamed protein product [Rhizophagus irregularis]|nr:unnamed protein product [Rhizophagus irregularis]
MKKEKVSATEYIFDFDSNDMSAEVLEFLCQWPTHKRFRQATLPTQDEIYGAIRIAYLNAEKFARLVALSKSETSLCPFVYIDNSHLDAEQEHAEVNTAINFNPLISENDQLCDVAKEVTQTAFINQHKELHSYVNDDNIFGEYDELGGLNEDLELCASRSNDQMDNLSKINSNEIIYLLNHQKSATIPTISANLRSSYSIIIMNWISAFNLDEDSRNRIERNAANELVRSFQENDSY